MQNELGINRISPSMLMEYEGCPRLFYFRSFLGIKLPQPQVHLLFGTAMHLAVDNVYEQWDKKDGWTLADKSIPRGIFKDNFTLACVDPDLHSPEECQRIYDEMLADGLAIVDAFWEEKDVLRAKGVNPTVFEQIVKMPIHIPGCDEPWEVPISARIDGINTDLDPEKIAEFKTSSKPYVYTETRDSLQSKSYAVIRYCITGKIPEVDYVVLRKKVKKDKIQHLSIKYEPADMLAFDRKVKSILSKIRNREFAKPMKGHQKYCDCYKFEELFHVEK